MPPFVRTLRLADLVESQKLSEATEQVQDRRHREASMEDKEEKEYPVKSSGKYS